MMKIKEHEKKMSPLNEFRGKTLDSENRIYVRNENFDALKFFHSELKGAESTLHFNL